MSVGEPRPVFDREWRTACDLVPTSRNEVDHMIKSHYIGRWPGVCVLTLGLRHEGKFVGVIVFALPPRETMKRYGGVTWELARLWIHDSVPKNAETYVIGRSIRYIKRFHKEVAALVSYADPSAGHTGTVYKASNWTADGKTDGERKTPRFDYADADTGKRYSRRGHVPEGAQIQRVPRVSKYRYFYALRLNNPILGANRKRICHDYPRSYDLGRQRAHAPIGIKRGIPQSRWRA